MEGLLAEVRRVGDKLIEAASPELAEYRLKNPTFKHPLEGWAFTSFESAVGVVVAYLLFVFVGSFFMKVVRGNKPIKALDGLKYWYNPVQTWLSAWLCIEAGRQAYFMNDAKLVGNAFVPGRREIASVLYVFYLSKLLDFVDTLFIVLGCKWRQLSVLHVYHHASIWLTYWWIVRAGWDGDIYLTIVLNGAVHAVMYLYYTITSLSLRDTVPEHARGPAQTLFVRDAAGAYTAVPKTGPDADERERVTPARVYSPKWKRFITYFQMAQFLAMNAQGVYLIFFHVAPANTLAYPRLIIIYYVIYIQSLFWLFRNFASENYSDKKSSKAAAGAAKKAN